MNVNAVLRLLNEINLRAPESSITTRANCIEQCRLYREVLRGLKIPVKEVVTRAAVHVPGRHHLCLLGWSDSERRAVQAQHAVPMNATGFQGHLVLIVADHILLDPSLNQVKYADGSYIMPREFVVLNTNEPILAKFPTFSLHLKARLDDGNEAEITWVRKNNDGYKKSRAWELDRPTLEVAALLERQVIDTLAREATPEDLTVIEL